MIRSTRVLALATALLLTAAACAPGGGASPAPGGTGTAATAVQPTRPVEFVISTAPGGGSDIYARLWITVIEKEKFSTSSILPVNKEGGSGAVAFLYLFEKKSDMHYIMSTLNSFWTTTITQKNLPYKVADFTPIAALARDPFFLWVPNDSPIKTAQDFVRVAKERSLVVAGTGTKQEDEVLFRRIQDVAQTRPFTFVPQDSGGAVARALATTATPRIEATVNNPSEGLGLFQATPPSIRPVCAFTADAPTAAAFKDLPTCKSQGLAIDDYHIIRSVVGPPGLSAAQQKYWSDLFEKVSQSTDWKDFMSKNALVPDFRSGEQFKKLIEDYDKLHRDIATKNGWI